jgi:arylsulfatase A-like enzyme
MSFMGWEPLPDGVETLAQLLRTADIHTAAMVDTPFYLRGGMNYDLGYQTFLYIPGQAGDLRLVEGLHEALDARETWRFESDHSVAQTMTKAMQWLQLHYKEDFFLYIDTWDPHEPWDAPNYYTEMYMPDYDGELVTPVYGRWQDTPGFTEAAVNKAHATYCGEVTLVDTWIGYLLRQVENMGLMEHTAIIFTTDHGFYFGEHDGLFGKTSMAKRPDGTLIGRHGVESGWGFSPLYDEVALLPMLVYLPGAEPGTYTGLTSAVDVMPTVLEIMEQEIPGWVEGTSLLPKIHDRSAPGLDFTVTTIPFADPGDSVHIVDNARRNLYNAPVITVTTDRWSLLYSVEEGLSELYDLSSDPSQQKNVISSNVEVAGEIHRYLVDFMRKTNLPERLLKSRLELRI